MPPGQILSHLHRTRSHIAHRMNHITLAHQRCGFHYYFFGNMSFICKFATSNNYQHIKIMKRVRNRISNISQRVNRLYARAFIDGASQRPLTDSLRGFYRGESSDTDALRGDWYRVGNDIRVAISKPGARCAGKDMRRAWSRIED